MLSNVFDALIHSESMMILALFFSILFYFSWMRRKDRKWIEQCFGSDEILAISFGAIRFQRRPLKSDAKKQKGCLILLSHGLVFKPNASIFQSGVEKQVFEILKEDAQTARHSASHKGCDLNQSVINVDFLNAAGGMDSAAFKVPYPPQWLGAIEKCFFKQTADPKK